MLADVSGRKDRLADRPSAADCVKASRPIVGGLERRAFASSARRPPRIVASVRGPARRAHGWVCSPTSRSRTASVVPSGSSSHKSWPTPGQSTHVPAEVGQSLGSRVRQTAGESSDSRIVEGTAGGANGCGMVRDVAEDPDRHPPVEPAERQVAPPGVVRPHRWASAVAQLLRQGRERERHGGGGPEEAPARRPPWGASARSRGRGRARGPGEADRRPARRQTRRGSARRARSSPVGSVSTRSSANASRV